MRRYSMPARRVPPAGGPQARTAAGALFIPAAASQRDALLQLFVLDKALYELNYELNNRPDWVRIPLRGIFELLEDSRPE